MSIVGNKKTKKKWSKDLSSMSSSISTAAIERIIEGLKCKRNRPSTNRMYYGVWKQFNEFFIRLENKPRTWEDRLTLFVGYLVNEKLKASTIRSYISGIKSVLMDDGIEINEDRYLLTSLTKACKYVNNGVRMRLPIQKGLLQLFLGEIDHIFGNIRNQPYLNTLYKTVFITAYYGLFRIGEVSKGSHPVLARDVHISDHKNKLLFLLRTLKMNWLDSKPQTVRISSTSRVSGRFHPFELLREFLEKRDQYECNSEPFFVFSDGSAVTPANLRKVLSLGLQSCKVDDKLYSFHSLRIGRSVDLWKVGVKISEICKIGRWRSNTVYRYLS